MRSKGRVSPKGHNVVFEGPYFSRCWIGGRLKFGREVYSVVLIRVVSDSGGLHDENTLYPGNIGVKIDAGNRCYRLKT